MSMYRLLVGIALIPCLDESAVAAIRAKFCVSHVPEGSRPYRPTWNLTGRYNPIRSNLSLHEGAFVFAFTFPLRKSLKNDKNSLKQRIVIYVYIYI